VLGEDAGFSCCAFDRTGQRLFVGSKSGEVRIFSIDRMDPLAAAAAHDMMVVTLIASEAGGMLVSSSEVDVKVWADGGLSAGPILTVQDASAGASEQHLL
jgi:hypothetical protein